MTVFVLELEYDPRERIAALKDALELPLLFHSGGGWDMAKRKRWTAITGTDEATSRVMCDAIRRVLATGADKTGRVPYNHVRNRQCSIGYHGECTDTTSERCQCPCHRTANPPNVRAYAEVDRLRALIRDMTPPLERLQALCDDGDVVNFDHDSAIADAERYAALIARAKAAGA